MEHELTILSPEKTILTYPLAGFGRRVGAHLLDVLIVIIAITGYGTFIGFVIGSLDEAFAGGLMMFGSAAIPFLYFILLEGLWNGLTVGKLACGLRVRMADGTPVRFGAALSRNLLRMADMLPPPYFAGLLAIFSTPRSQRIGDLVAGTVVVREARVQPRFSPAPHKAGIHPFESHVGELRGMTDEEYVALKRFCDRFPELSPPVQEKLIRDVWNPIAVRRGIQPLANVHPLYLAEASVMRYGRTHGLV